MFENSNFTGASTDRFDKPGVVHNLWASGWNDRASSIRVPSGRTVRLWEDTNGKGNFLDLTPGNWDLWEKGWNDKASSMMTWKETRKATAARPPRALRLRRR